LLNKVYVSFFENNYPPALPPFSLDPLPTFAFKPNRRDELVINNDSSFTFYAEEEGIFHFQTDTNTYDGKSVFNFGNKFPRITEPEKMVEPVRYISSKNEYTNISNSNQPKTALDLFWISIAGNYERGRQIIKEYYTRVESSNKLFSSFQEGWKTDRGIIYVVFGSPNLIYKNESTEKWIYGEENNALSIAFEFNKVENPFSENDYVLTRNPIHKNAWYRAVEAWRQGRIY
jgi:GWxTD domain-containing protein